MERHEILEAMTELKLYGMRASFDEIAGKGLNRRDEIFPLLASLIRAERTHRQARSISYRMSGAKFPSELLAPLRIVSPIQQRSRPISSSFREANGTTIAVSCLACMLQFVPRSAFEAKLCKGGK